MTCKNWFKPMSSAYYPRQKSVRPEDNELHILSKDKSLTKYSFTIQKKKRNILWWS